MDLEYFLKAYLRKRPLFLSLIRAKEAELYQKYLSLKRPVLDVGCGDGFFAKITFAKKLKIKNAKLKIKENIIDVGLDVKKSRVEEAIQSRVYEKVIVYDGKEMPFPDNSFNTVISNCVLEHIPDLDKTLKEIHRVLKSGGLFLTTVVAKPWEDYFFGNLIFGRFYKNWMCKMQKHHHLNTDKQWSTLFKKHGFKIEERIGYLDKKAVRFIDIFHYLSFPSLISYKLWKKWVLWQDKPFIFPSFSWLVKLISPDISSDKSGNIFFSLKK